MKKIITAVLIFVGFAAVAQTERIVFTAPMMYPEGVTYNKETDLFYVSSVKTGTIGTVDNAGTYKMLYSNPELKASFGMKVDVKNNRLLVCLSDPNKKYSKYTSPATLKKMARVISIDIATGKKLADIDLAKLAPGKHFANDIALDDKGNFYVTDSYSPLIYKVDAQNKATIFAKNELFKSDDIGLNGIVYHPGGYLLVAHSGNGALLKVDVNNSKVSMVKMKVFFPGADGLLWENNNLVLVQNEGVNKIFQISSNDNWMSAEVKAATATADRFQQPTTVAMQNGKVWVLNSKMNELSDSSITPSKEFSLQLARFQPVQ